MKITDQTVEEGEVVELEPEATDPEGEDVVVTYMGWMTSNTKATTFDDAGVHTVIVKASDGERETLKNVTITVTDMNRAPSFGDGAFN